MQGLNTPVYSPGWILYNIRFLPAAFGPRHPKGLPTWCRGWALECTQMFALCLRGAAGCCASLTLTPCARGHRRPRCRPSLSASAVSQMSCGLLRRRMGPSGACPPFLLAITWACPSASTVRLSSPASHAMSDTHTHTHTHTHTIHACKRARTHRIDTKMHAGRHADLSVSVFALTHVPHLPGTMRPKHHTTLATPK